VGSNFELAHWLARRTRAYGEFQARLLRSSAPQDLVAEQARFVTDMVRDCQALAIKIMGCGTQPWQTRRQTAPTLVTAPRVPWRSNRATPERFSPGLLLGAPSIWAGRTRYVNETCEATLASNLAEPFAASSGQTEEEAPASATVAAPNANVSGSPQQSRVRSPLGNVAPSAM